MTVVETTPFVPLRRDGGRCVGQRGDDAHIAGDKIRRKLRKTGQIPVGPAEFDPEVLAFDEAGVAQALAKAGETLGVRFNRAGMQKTDDRHGLLLGPGGHGRKGRRADQSPDEVSPPHDSRHPRMPPTRLAPLLAGFNVESLRPAPPCIIYGARLPAFVGSE